MIGLASALVLALHGRIAGISGILNHTLDRDARQFRIPFIAGLITTGAIAAQLTPSTIGAPVRGLAMLAIAGILVGIGTTVGSGCTSGHGVCGIGRFSKLSLVAVIVFMTTAAITVAIAGGS